MNWSRSTDSGSTENARLENRKLFKILFKLLYLRFPPLQIRTCVFRTCNFPPLHICTYVFRTCIFHPQVLSFFELAFKVAPTSSAFFCHCNMFRVFVNCWQNGFTSLQMALTPVTVHTCDASEELDFLLSRAHTFD